jgi:DNA-directed RNA polymerase specialized sigma24 family protein
MSDDNSVSVWLEPLKKGDPQAAQQLWNRYYEQLVRLARRKLQGASRRVADEEDVALSAFHSFCEGAAHGKFPQLDDRDNLWRVLVIITARKASRLAEHERRQKRGGGTLRGESVFLSEDDDVSAGIQQVVGDEPTPEFAVQVAEEHHRLLSKLDEDLRQIAQWKLEGYTNEEIAQRAKRGVRTIQRKLNIIQREWLADESAERRRAGHEGKGP